jgi:hypothetical protein
LRFATLTIEVNSPNEGLAISLASESRVPVLGSGLDRSAPSLIVATGILISCATIAWVSSRAAARRFEKPRLVGALAPCTTEHSCSSSRPVALQFFAPHGGSKTFKKSHPASERDDGCTTDHAWAEVVLLDHPERFAIFGAVRVDRTSEIVCVLCAASDVCEGDSAPSGWLEAKGWRCPACADVPLAMNPRDRATLPFPSSSADSATERPTLIPSERVIDLFERPTLPVPSDDD